MKTIVALEVTADAIHVAEIAAPMSKRPRLLNVATIPLEEDIAGESILYAGKQFSEILKKAWKKHKFRSKSVALVVGGRFFVVRAHDTQQPTMKDLMKVIEYEAAQAVPENMSNPILTFYPTIKSEKNPLITKGLVVAAASEGIEKIAEALADADLKIEYVDYAPMAIARFMRRDVQDKGSYVVVNVRKETTDVIFGRDGVPLFVRTINRGLPADYEEQDVEFHTSAPGDTIVSLSREIKVTVESFSGAQIDNVYVCGNGSLGRTLSDAIVHAISDATDAKPEPLVPRVVETMKGKKELSLQKLSANFVAVCAGMRGEKL